MNRLRLLPSALLAICVSPQVHGQAQAALTAEDSARVIIATLQVITDSLTRPTSSEPIWIRVRHIPRERSAQRRMVTLSEYQWGEINAVVPTARPIPHDQSPFLCPQGVQMSLPGRGCPIKDGGTVYRPWTDAGRRRLRNYIRDGHACRYSRRPGHVCARHRNRSRADRKRLASAQDHWPGHHLEPAWA